MSIQDVDKLTDLWSYTLNALVTQCSEPDKNFDFKIVTLIKRKSNSKHR